MSEEKSPGDAFTEERIDSVIDFGVSELSLSEKEKLSYALFPETHTKSVQVLGKERILRPLTIKYSRIVNKLLEPYMDRLSKTAVEGSEEAATGVPMDLILTSLFRVVKSMADFYGNEWEDIKIAIESEDIALVEMEGVVVQQSHLNTVNDFLLVPLRTLIRMMQLQEIRNVRLESLANMYITLPLQSSGDVPSTTLSPTTPTDS